MSVTVHYEELREAIVELAAIVAAATRNDTEAVFHLAATATNLKRVTVRSLESSWDDLTPLEKEQARQLAASVSMELTRGKS